MGKVHPQPIPSTVSSNQQVFTIWMKSLVPSSYGCTVFDSSGQLVYRVDNYSHKRSDQVHLMDITGRVLYSIVKKKFRLMAQWEGYSCRDDDANNKKKPRFQVKRSLCLFRGRGVSMFKVLLGLDINQPLQYKMESQNQKSTCKIVDNVGSPVAEVKKKVSAGGVDLGEDVLTMVVEPYTDHTLIMGLIVVYSLINGKM